MRECAASFFRLSNGAAFVVRDLRPFGQTPCAAASSEPPLAIDVRAPRERDEKHIAGSLAMPLNHLTENLQKLPKNRSLLVYCAGGYRSSIAASLLRRGGFDHVSEIAGGIAGWE